MTFFEDFKIDTSLKVGITNLLSNITIKPGSHKGGWARLLKCQLDNLGFRSVQILDNKNSLNQFDVIIFDLGAEYSGAINLFGGLDEKVFKRLNEIKEFKGQIFSWRNQLPDVTVLESRRTNVSTCQSFKDTDPGFLGSVQQVLGTSKVFAHSYRTKNLLIGDSHTPSVWTPDFMIERQDGRTLYGSLQNRLISRIVKEHGPLEVVQIHMSSIDIRHHVCRQPEPEMSVLEMLNSLGHELIDLKNQGYLQHVILTQTMGIEDISRDLPKTGFYKGTPFFGDWDTRNRVRNYFNEKIKEMAFMNNRANVFEWGVLNFPEYFFDFFGKLKFDVMEVPGSVHLSPEHYCWDLDKNIRRW